MKNRYVRVKFSDGTQWDIPLSEIALSREEYYKEENDLSLEENEDFTAKYFEKHAEDYDVLDWCSNNVNWEDIEQWAEQVVGPNPIDRDEEWCNAEKKVVEK